MKSNSKKQAYNYPDTSVSPVSLQEKDSSFVFYQVRNKLLQCMDSKKTILPSFRISLSLSMMIEGKKNPNVITKKRKN